MASNGKKRIPPQGQSEESRIARQRRVLAIKQAVNSGSYSIHTEDIVLNVLREVLQG